MNKRMNLRHVAAGIICIAVLAVSVPSCDRNDTKTIYRAERELFKARSLREKVATATNKSEFLDKTIQAYRDIVKEFGQSAGQIEGLEQIVVSAQMDLAQLEYQSFEYERAIMDFKAAYAIAKTLPEARANALYSIAVISSEMEDYEEAIANYEKFHEEFLKEESILLTAEMNTLYLLVPLKLFELNATLDREDVAHDWLFEAELKYLYAIENGVDSALTKEIQFNLLTAYLHGKHWNKSREKVQELKEQYVEETDIPALLYLEAKIYQEGFGNSDKALTLYEMIYGTYPRSREATIALLASGSILMDAKEYERAKTQYERVIEEYPEASGEAAEAAWHLARIAEAQGDWLNASLMYESIAVNHPGTIQGFEAPLRIASHYAERNESAAARAAYGKAINQYKELMTQYIDMDIKVTAENYIVRALTEQKKWREAAELLQALPERYPAYVRLRGNYLLAASIYEKELGDRSQAISALQRCLDRYPGTALAEEAERQLRQLKGRK